MSARRSALRPYAAGVFTVTMVTVVKLALTDVVGREGPFALLGLSVVAAGWLGGARGAVVATVLATLSGWFYFLHPYDSWALSDTSSIVRVVAVLAEGCAVSFIVARMERARSAAESSAASIAALQRLTAALAAAGTPEQIGDVLIRQGVERLGAARAVFVECTDDGRLEVLAQHRADAASDALPSALLEPVRAVMSRAVPEWIESTEAYARSYPTPATSVPIGAAASLPLSLGGRALGAVTFFFAAPRAFTAVERASMENLVTQAAQALERAQLFTAEVRLRRRLELLGELAHALSSSLTRADVAQVVVERGMRAAHADTCTLYARDPEDGSLVLIGDAGVDAAVLDRIRRIAPSSGNPSFRTMATGDTVWAENEEQYVSFYPELAQMKAGEQRARAFWLVSLISEGQSIGILGMGFYAPRTFPPEERAFVSTFARHCAEALRRAELVHAERMATEAAQRLQSSLETTLRSIGDAVIATDARGAVTLMNPVAEELTGWSEREAAGQELRHVFRIKNEHTGLEVENPAVKVLRDGVVVGLANHTVLVRRDGARETPIDDSGAPIRGESGAITGVVLVFRDVSTSKREEMRREFLADATSALAESLDYQATLARVAKLAVPRLADWCAVDLDETGQGEAKRLAVAHVDPAKVEMARELAARYRPRRDDPTGVPAVLRSGRAELYKEIPDELLVRAAVDEEHLRIARELGLRSAMIVPLIARGRVLGAMSFVHAESGRAYAEDDLQFAEDLAHRCAVAIDNAQLYASEQRARRVADVANSSKDEFLAMVSHELRTPLNAIMGWAKMLTTRVLDEEKKTRAVATIERNAVAMARLIEDLLDIARITSGKMRLELERVDIAQVIAAAVEAVRPGADAKDVQLIALVHDGAGPITGDPARLQQVVWNLLSNAVKFTPKGGRVEIVLRRLESSLEIVVTDTGAGIDRAFLPFVFEAFRQEKAAQRASRAGLGLGLAITRQLVELHGGHIEAKSDGEGRGATFTVRLPVRAVNRTAPSDAKPDGSGSDGVHFDRPAQLQGLRVLVVDDDDDSRHLVKAVLEHCGSVVEAVAGVDDALRALRARLPDVLISDIGMPGRDGYELIREIRALPASHGGHLPAAALTANAYAEDRRRVLNAGFTMHIAKPVEPAELVAVVVSLSRYSPSRAAE